MIQKIKLDFIEPRAYPQGGGGGGGGTLVFSYIRRLGPYFEVQNF